MPVETPTDQFRVERHGEIAVVFPSPKVEEMHEAHMDQAAKMVLASLREDPPAGIVIDLSQLNYFGSVFVNFLLRCYMHCKKQGLEFVLAGPSAASRELFKVLGFESLWALYNTRQEAIEALSGSD
jgi:anti-sigma B factor antagonist